jgi:hypothetical protein
MAEAKVTNPRSIRTGVLGFQRTFIETVAEPPWTTPKVDGWDRYLPVPREEPAMEMLTSSPPLITVVHSAACHFCEDARVALAELCAEIPLQVEWVAAEAPRGEELVAEHRTPMYPLVLVDGVFFSFGRLSRKKLRRLLVQRTGAAVA